jgi:hypothetical protein
MKEDILEQLVDDYLMFNGYFTIHNVKFRPCATHQEYVKNQDSSFSDVDVVGFNPLLKGCDRTWVVSCKSWQAGFDPAGNIAKIDSDEIIHGRPRWKSFRELAKPKWGHGLIAKVQELTGSTQFTYLTAVTKLKGDARAWEEHRPFKKNLRGNPIRILTLQEMLNDLYKKADKTLASSEIGRLLQVIKASGWKP